LFHGSPIASLRVCLVPPRARSSLPCWLRSCSLFSVPRVFRLSHSWPWIFSWRHSVANGGQVSTLSIRYVCSQLSGCGAVSVAQYCCLPNFGRCGRSQDRVSVNCPLVERLYPAERIWLRNIFAQMITPLDINGIGQNWEDSNSFLPPTVNTRFYDTLAHFVNCQGCGLLNPFSRI